MVIHYHVYKNLAGHAMAQAFICQPLTVQAKVQSQANPCGICGGKSGTETDISPHTAVSIITILPPMLDTHLAPILYSLTN
jgi:hypothetical protein